MGRPPCCDENGLKKGPWTDEEDKLLVDFIQSNGVQNWKLLPKLAGLNRCGKSCRLRWTNYLRPDIKRGKFTEEEQELIIGLHSVVGNKWSQIATHLPGRTDNEIKNFWNTHLRKKLLQKGIDPVTHRPTTDPNFLISLPQLLALANASNSMRQWDKALMVQVNAATELAKLQVLHNLLQVINTTSSSAVSNTSSINHLGSAQNPANNHFLNQYIHSQSNNQFGNSPLSLGPDTNYPNQVFKSNSDTNCDDQMPSSNLMNNINNMEENGWIESYLLAHENTFPALTSASPESSSMKETESKVSPTDTFEDWGHFNIFDESNGSCKKDFIV